MFTDFPDRWQGLLHLRNAELDHEECSCSCPEVYQTGPSWYQQATYDTMLKYCRFMKCRLYSESNYKHALNTIF